MIINQFQTKFQVGDTAFFLKNNNVGGGSVEKIKILITPDEIQEKVTLFLHDHTIMKNIPADQLFTSDEDLANFIKSEIQRNRDERKQIDNSRKAKIEVDKKHAEEMERRQEAERKKQREALASAVKPLKKNTH